MRRPPLRELRGAQLIIENIELRDANAFVAQHHRHHGPARGHRYSIAARDGGRLVGVAIVGRPVARNNDDGRTVEITRLATDGTPNACSKLLAAARRAAFALGYTRVITYTLADESGASLRAAGWNEIGIVKGRSWTTPSRPRIDSHPTIDKRRWECVA